MPDIIPSDAFPQEPMLHRSVSAYEATIQQVGAMGFSAENVQIAIAYTRSTDPATVLEFLIKDDHGWQHPFLPGESDHNLCSICGEDLYQHPEDLGQASKEDIQEKLALFERHRAQGSSLEEIRPEVRCMICLEECKEPWSHPDCEEHVFCLDCVRSYLRTRITDGNVLSIACPGDSCKALFSESQVQEFVDEETVGKYRRFRERAEMAQDPSVRWCPQPNCEGYMRGSESDPHLTCPFCHYEVCFKCNSQWHGKQSCEQHLDAAYEEWAKGQDVQLCPRCKLRIEKVLGCNHITCSVCRYEWCWLCRGAYSRNHFSPLNPFGCSNLQAEANTRARWPLWKIYLSRVGYLLLMILLIALSPLIALFAPAVALTRDFHREHERYGTCGLICADIGVFVGVLLMTPIVAVISIPVLLVIGVVRMIKWILAKCFG